MNGPERSTRAGSRPVAERIAALPPRAQAELLRRLRPEPPAAPTPARPPTPAPGQASGAALVRFRPDPEARLRLVCFPYAGGGASMFRSWSQTLNPAVEVCAVQPPGRETRIAEPAHRRIEALVTELADALAPCLDRPFAFFGHSMGALVAFELARRLRRESGLRPVRLTVAAFRAPHLPNPHIKIHHLPDEVFKVVLRQDGVAERILDNDELMQAMMPTLRADFEACDTYRYAAEPPLECPLTVFGGREDRRVGREDLSAWARHAASRRLRMFPGSHFFLHGEHDRVLDAVRDDLLADLELMGEQHAS